VYSFSWALRNHSRLMRTSAACSENLIHLGSQRWSTRQLSRWTRREPLPVEPPVRLLT